MTASSKAIATDKLTHDGLHIYDLDPQAAELWAVAGPADVDPSTIDPDFMPDGFRWIDDDEWAQAPSEFAYGAAYARAMRGEQGFSTPVDIEKMLMGSSSVSNDDYRAMVNAGIENPNARRYWDGFNSVFE